MLRKYRAGLIGAGLAVATFLALVVVVIAGLGLQCRAAGAGFGACFLHSEADVNVASLGGGQGAAAGVDTTALEITPAVPVPKAAPTNQVIEASSDIVPSERLGTAGAAAVAPAVQALPKSFDGLETTPAARTGAPETRQVRTVTIRPETVQPIQPTAPASDAPALAASPEVKGPELPPLAPLKPSSSVQPAEVAIAEPAEVIPEETAALEEPELIAPIPQPRPEQDDDAAQTAVVGRSGVNVRAAPATSGKKLFALTPGQKVTVTKTDKGWLQIRDAKGRTGWLYSTYVSTQKGA